MLVVLLRRDDERRDTKLNLEAAAARKRGVVVVRRQLCLVSVLFLLSFFIPWVTFMTGVLLYGSIDLGSPLEERKTAYALQPAISELILLT